jgi:hypothetical protein
MRFPLAGLFLVLTVVSASPLAWAQPISTDQDVLSGIFLAEDRKDYDGGMQKLTAAVRRLEQNKPGSDDLAVGYLYLGVCHAAKGQKDTARSMFQRALDLRPDLTLDPQMIPAAVLSLFTQVRAKSGGWEKGGAGSPLPIAVGLLGAVGSAYYLGTKGDEEEAPAVASESRSGLLTANQPFATFTFGPFPAGPWSADLHWSTSNATLKLEVFDASALIMAGAPAGTNILRAEWTGTATASYRFDLRLTNSLDTNFELRLTHPKP